MVLFSLYFSWAWFCLKNWVLYCAGGAPSFSLSENCEHSLRLVLWPWRKNWGCLRGRAWGSHVLKGQSEDNREGTLQGARTLDTAGWVSEQISKHYSGPGSLQKKFNLQTGCTNFFRIFSLQRISYSSALECRMWLPPPHELVISWVSRNLCFPPPPAICSVWTFLE